MRVLDRVIDKQFKQIVNEVMAFKVHYITCLLEEVKLGNLNIFYTFFIINYTLIVRCKCFKPYAPLKVF